MQPARTILIFLVLLTTEAGASPQQSPEILPTVVQHSEPRYPPLARQTNIQGEVRVKITTDGETVREAEAETGNPLLRKSAEDNARTWRFVPHPPGTFHVTFRYKLLLTSADVEFLESTATVRITAAPPELVIDYAWVGLGTWKAQLKSAHGKSFRMLKLSSSGPKGEWPEGRASGPNGENEKIDYGYKEEDFLNFSMKLTQPAGIRINTFLAGKIKGEKIVGTFVDDGGIRGEWTATRTADVPNSR